MKRNWIFDTLTSWDVIFSQDSVMRWTNWINHAQSKHVFFHPTLVKAWIDTYRPIRDIEPMFIWGRSTRSNNQMFLPLVVWRKNWKNAFIKAIVPVGYSDFDYHDPIFMEKPSSEELDEFWNEMLQYLGSVKGDEILIDGVCHTGVRVGTEWSQGDICPTLDITSIKNDDDLYKVLKTSLRGDVRRQTRRLLEKGELSLKRYSTWDEAEFTFDKFIAEHKNKWPHAYKAPHFHENILKNALEAGIADFTALTIDGEPVAWHLGYHYDGRYYYYMPCGDREYSRFSPVKVHLFNLISNAIANGDEVFDHLKGAENYKDGWSDSYHYVYNYTRYSSRPISQLKRSIAHLAHKLR